VLPYPEPKCHSDEGEEKKEYCGNTEMELGDLLFVPFFFFLRKLCAVAAILSKRE